MGAESTHRPSIATSPSGKIYVVWLAEANAKPDPSDQFVFIPEEFTDTSVHPEFATVPGISIFDGKQWSAPRLLVSGIRECSPLFAWCSGEDLNLLVNTDKRCLHLRYDADKKSWKQIVRLSEVPSFYSEFLLKHDVLHVASLEGDGVVYRRLDSKGWNKPVPMNVGTSRVRIRIAVDRASTAYLVWRATEGGKVGFAAIAADGKVTDHTIKLDVKSEDGFDIAIDPKGRLLLASQGREDAVQLQAWDTKNWSVAGLVGKGMGVMDDIRMRYTEKKIVLTWQHRGRYTVDRMVVSGPVRSYSIFDGSSWTGPHPVCRMPHGSFPGGFMNSFFVGLHVDASERVHIAWGDGPFNYHCVFADLGMKQ